METRRQGATLFSAILVLIATLVIVQLWILAAGLDALLAREVDVLVPMALSSLALAALSAGLLWYVVAFDDRLRRQGRHG
jgi:Family of unknown function (DUF6755)